MNSEAGSSDRNYIIKRALVELKEMRSKLDDIERARTEPIAIIGQGCRFPGQIQTPEDFWHLLQTGTDTTSEVPTDRWDLNMYYDPSPEAPGKIYTRWGGFLTEVDRFDAHFFNISPREAISMDPQHRLILEVAWEALEDAAVAPSSLAGSRTGVFIGITTNDYVHLYMKSSDLADIDAYASIGNPFNFAAGRLSYTLGLQGPSITVDTACSSSLVTIHLACQSLRAGECQVALAGGVNLILSPEVNITLSKACMLAADGRCKTFDVSADGYGRGEGCGIVVLKRLSDALAAGDPILALIRGSAVNQNGPSSGITVPCAQAQEAVIRQALVNAGIEPAQVSYVEVHGTGTALGDPIEVRALASVLCQNRPPDHPLIIGAAKTNIGHLEAAAGVASLIKVVLALHHKEIPPHLHLQTRNPAIPWNEVSVEVPTVRIPWPSGQQQHIAGVSSFGVSGTNAHVILEEAPKRDSVTLTAERPTHLLALSAKSAEALQESAQRWETYLRTFPSISLADICFTANAGRSHFDHRLAIVGKSVAQMQDLLAVAAQGKKALGILHGKTRSTDRPKIAFLFTGQGSQYVNMGKQLYETQPTFRQALQRCDQLLRPYLEIPLLSVLYPKTDQHRRDSTLHQSDPLDETTYTQPALFALEYSLATLWRSWGIEPTAVLGHSVGEYVAACDAGVFSLEDGLKMIAERAKLMQALPQEGTMIAVVATEELVEQVIAPYQQKVAIAAFNGPEDIVISGAYKEIELIEQNFQARGVKTHRLRVSHAFHSPLMEPMLAPFTQVVKQVTFRTPQVWLVSNVTGQFVTGNEIAEASYWCRHTREAVRYWAGIQTLQAHGCQFFIEIGPGTTLLGMGKKGIASHTVATSLPCLGEDVPGKNSLRENISRENAPRENIQEWLPSLRKGRDDWQQLQESLGSLYVHGISVDWVQYAQGSGHRRGQLPTYPWQRERYWLEETAPAQPSRRDRTNLQPIHPSILHPLLGQRLPSPLKQIQFESHLSIDSIPIIREHIIYDQFVVPGVVYLEMAMAGIEKAFGTDIQALEELFLLQPIVLNREERRTIQLVLIPDNIEEQQTIELAPAHLLNKVSFQIFSLPANADGGNETWHLHVTGRFLTKQADIPPLTQELVSLEAIRERCNEEISGTEFYQSIWSQHFQLGPSFRRIEKLWRGNGEVLGRLHFSRETTSQSPQVRPEILVLDACVQLLIAALPRDKDAITATEQDVYVGAGQEFLRIYGSFSDIGAGPITRASPMATVWCQVLLCPSHDYKAEICGDLLIFNEGGQLVAEIRGVRFKHIGSETLQRLARTSITQQREKTSLSRDKLLTTQPRERQSLLEAYLCEEVSKVLRLPPSKLDPKQPLASLLDSLMVIELKNQIDLDLAMTVPAALFLDNDDIPNLARLLLEYMTADVDTLSQSLEQVDDKILMQVLAELEQLSDEEAEQALAAKMASKEKC